MVSLDCLVDMTTPKYNSSTVSCQENCKKIKTGKEKWLQIPLCYFSLIWISNNMPQNCARPKSQQLYPSTVLVQEGWLGFHSKAGITKVVYDWLCTFLIRLCPKERNEASYGFASPSLEGAT